MANPAPGYDKHPNHRVTISPAQTTVTVTAGNRQLAKSHRALLVDEARHELVFYLPRADVDMTLLEATDHSTYCPFKGHASYFSVIADAAGESTTDLNNSVWSYESPYDECLELKDHLAFYSDRLTVRSSDD